MYFIFNYKHMIPNTQKIEVEVSTEEVSTEEAKIIANPVEIPKAVETPKVTKKSTTPKVTKKSTKVEKETIWDWEEKLIKVELTINLAFWKSKFKKWDKSEFTQKELDCFMEDWYKIL